MADVTIKYKGSTIAEMSGTDTKTLQTAGMYCEDNIIISSINMEETKYFSMTPIDITIGANTVALGGDLITYINDLYGDVAAMTLLSAPTTKNQLMILPGSMLDRGISQSTNPFWIRALYRYRDGKIQITYAHNNYAVVLPQGAKYRVWLANVNTTI